MSNHASTSSSADVAAAVRRYLTSRRSISNPVPSRPNISSVSSPTHAVDQFHAWALDGRVLASRNSQGISARPAPARPRASHCVAVADRFVSPSDGAERAFDVSGGRCQRRSGRGLAAIPIEVMQATLDRRQRAAIVPETECHLRPRYRNAPRHMYRSIRHPGTMLKPRRLSTLHLVNEQDGGIGRLRFAIAVIVVAASALIIGQKHLLARPWPGLLLVLVAALPFVVDASWPRRLPARPPVAAAIAITIAGATALLFYRPAYGDAAVLFFIASAARVGAAVSSLI